MGDKPLIMYGGEKIDCGHDDTGWYCYLSNNYVMKPWHCCCLTDEKEEIIFALENEDIALVKVSVDKPSLFTCTLIGSLQYKLSNGCAVEFVGIIGSDYLATFNVGYDVHPGDSGTIIYHEGSITKDCSLTSETINGQVPLYMIIARSKAKGSRRVLAIYLPYLLDLGRKEINRQDDIRNGRASSAATHTVIATTTLLLDWEFVCTDLVRTAIHEAAKTAKRKRTDKLTTLAGSSEFDKLFFKNLKDFVRNGTEVVPQDKSQKKYLQDAQLLLHAFLVANEVGPFSHKCWVVKADQDGCKNRADAIFKMVWAFMARFEMVNIDVDGDVAKLYSGSEHPIAVDSQLLKVWQTTRNGKDNSVCHHPLLCEGNGSVHCRGTVMETKKVKGTVDDKEVMVTELTDTPVLCHCCVRPSHLVKLNNGFNSFCTGTLQELGRAHPGCNIDVSVKCTIPQTLPSQVKRERTRRGK